MEVVKNTYRIIFYTLILSVYAIFFSVQSFYNFEGNSNSQEVFSHYSILHATHGCSVLAKARPLRSSTGHKTRLNKRYHQENILPCEVVSIVIPERYIPLQTPDFSRQTVLPSPILVNYTLRGPPAVA
ncbi:MAG TPA: hypothetical protein VL832_02205 [Puia sp.]|jgi:hypothetical protein|nr:hypothetical protein [Puia sp.]